SLGDEGECDFIDRIAQRHPLRVLATILGIDRDDEERLLELTQQLFASDDPATLLANTTLPGGETMGALETFGYYLIVFTAGHDTTRNALSGALAAFVEHPDELRKVGAKLALSKPAVE